MKLYVIWAFILLFLSSLYSCSFKIFEEERQFVVQYLANNKNDILFKTLPTKNGLLHYAQTKASKVKVANNQITDSQKQNKVIIFIHGTPGSWQDFGRFLTFEKLTDEAVVIAVDRLGWGKSILAKNISTLENKEVMRRKKPIEYKQTVETDFTKQASHISVLLDMLKQHEQSTILLVGHSLGAPIAAQITVDYPHLVDGLMLLAGTLNPAIESPRWYNHFSCTWLAKFIVPDALLRSNVEMMAKQAEIKQLATLYNTIKVPITVIHGDKDKLVNPKNLDYAKETFNRTTARFINVPKQGHILQIQQRELIVEEILRLLNKS